MGPIKRPISKNGASTSRKKRVVSKESTHKDNGKQPLEEDVSQKQQPNTTPRLKELNPNAEIIPAFMASYTESEKQDYIKFKYIKFAPSPTPCMDTFQKLGIHEDFLATCKEMGILKLALMESKVYEEACREFFSTVKVEFSNKAEPQIQNMQLKFKINGERFRVTIEELCEIYGFANHCNGGFDKFREGKNFWSMIGNGAYDCRMKVSRIRNPTLRILAKYLAQSLFFRYSNGNLTMPDVNLLYCGIHKHLLDSDGKPLISDDPNPNVNLGAIFAETMVRIRHSTVDVKVMRLGGLIHPILEKALCELPIYYSKANCAQEKMSMNYLVKNKIITLKSGLPQYSFETSTSIPKSIILPMVEKTAFSCLENIRFDYEDLNIGNAPSPQHIDDDLIGWEVPTLLEQPRTANDKSIAMIVRNQLKIIKKLANLEKLINKGKQCFMGSNDKETEHEGQTAMTPQSRDTSGNNLVEETFVDAMGEVHKVTNALIELAQPEEEGCSNTPLNDGAHDTN